MKPTVNVLYFPGTNCQEETLRLFRRVGAEPRLVFASDLLAERAHLDDSDIICIPGGFAFGDHLGAGTVAGLLLKTRLYKQIAACRDRLIVCICNGFQIAVRAGLFGQGVALTVNREGTFRNEPYQQHLVEPGNPSLWLTGLVGQTLVFPAAHGEGRFVYRQTQGWHPALRYPGDRNPNGSMDEVAGISTPDGRVLGLMDHPERSPDVGACIFENGVRAAAS